MDSQRTVSFVIDVVCGCAHGKTKNLKPLADHSYFFQWGKNWMSIQDEFTDVEMPE